MTRRTVIQVRVSDEEKARIAQLAEDHSLGMSDWVRARALTPLEGPRFDGSQVKPSRAAVAASGVLAARAGDVPTVAQLAGRTGLPRAACQRALDDGTWEGLL